MPSARRLAFPSLCVLALLPLALPALAETGPVPTGTSSENTVWTCAPADRAEITRLLDAAVAHGFPDAAGATIYQGDLLVAGALPEALAAFRGRGVEISCTPAAGTGTHGLHLKLADGRWLVGMTTPVAADGLDASKLTPLAPAAFEAALVSRAGAAYVPMTPAQIAAWLQPFPAAAHPALRAGLRWWPLSLVLAAPNQTEFDLGVLHLVRLGVPAAESAPAMLAAGQSMQRPPEEDRVTPLVLCPADLLRFARLQDERMRQRMQGGRARLAKVGFTVDSAPLVVAQVLQKWFRHHLAVPAGLSAEQAVTGMQAVLRPDMPQELREQTRLLVARAALPATCPADASFALRVALWDPPTTTGDRRVATMARNLLLAADPFTLQDLGALIALTGDTGASRWLDGTLHPAVGTQFPRTVGDNALRIITALLHVDPRVLLQRDPREPWSPAAQAATAAALQAWWRERAQRPLDEVLAAAIPNLDCGAAGRLILALPSAGRAPLVAALAAQWRAHPPRAAGGGELAEALVAVGDEPALAAAVRALPVAGAQRLVLATWHARHGSERQLDELLELALVTDAEPLPDYSGVGPSAVETIAMQQPTTACLKRLLASAAGDFADQATLRVFSLVFDPGIDPSPAMTLLTGADASGMTDIADAPGLGDQTMLRALQTVLLCDLRPLPVAMVRVEGNRLVLLRGADGACAIGGGSAAPVLPPDVRVCDLAGWAARGAARQWGLAPVDPSPGFPLGQPLAVRDAALGALRREVRAAAEPALAAAKLPPELLPQVGIPVKPTTKSEF